MAAARNRRLDPALRRKRWLRLVLLASEGGRDQRGDEQRVEAKHGGRVADFRIGRD
jgi:hypothetical protein